MAPMQRYENLIKQALKEIEEIDNDVPYSVAEPYWWVEMMELRSQLFRAIENMESRRI